MALKDGNAFPVKVGDGRRRKMALAQKLHPGRFPGMSGKMAAIVGYVLGEKWTEPAIPSLSITSDGFVVTMDSLIGTADDLERNVRNLLNVAGLTDEERAEWDRLYWTKVEDWRPLRGRSDARVQQRI
jgi:hypothetical protein